jgi:hypothetical protein
VGDGPGHERHYTVEQANAALPWVSERLERIEQALAVLDEPASRRALEELDPTHGPSYPGRAVAAAVLGLLAATSQLEALDIVLRDPRRGLVDFPAIREGSEVYLCWQRDEERVAWWHGPEAGFAGRRPL